MYSRKLYHRNIFWLNHFDIESKQLLLSVERVSNHLFEHIERRHDISVQSLLNIVQGLYTKAIRPFEVEVDDNNKVVKIVIRVPYDNDKDISMVIRDGFIVTYWFNDKTDRHKTLDKSKYEKC